MNHVRTLLYCLGASLVAACGGGGSSAPSPPIPVVTVTPATASVMVGQLIQLAATTNATEPVTWSSSNAAVATVSSTGVVAALALGQVTITATSGSGSATATLTTTTGIVFATVATGSNHTCGLTPRGVAYCWGNNSSGQLGNGTTTNSETPVPVSGGLIFSIVSAGGNQSCGLTTAGAAYCWGDNSSGQLGNGTTTNSTTPSLVVGGKVFFTISVGGKHACADGYCWGDNSFGQLGNGTTTDSSVPVPVPIPPGAYYSSISATSAGSTHTCGYATGNDGFLIISFPVCWGDNSSGQLGDGTTTNSAVPGGLAGNSGGFMSAGSLFTCSSSFPDYPTACWGNNVFGQLGDGTTTNSAVPVIIAGAKLASISSGGVHACGIVISSTGTPFSFVNCWGGNTSGQLGNGTTTNSAVPLPVALDIDFAMVSAGGSHTCAITSGSIAGSPTAGGAVYCWGDNSFGQLGNSWAMSSPTPVNVAGPQ